MERNFRVFEASPLGVKAEDRTAGNERERDRVRERERERDTAGEKNLRVFQIRELYLGWARVEEFE